MSALEEFFVIPEDAQPAPPVEQFEILVSQDGSEQLFDTDGKLLVLDASVSQVEAKTAYPITLVADRVVPIKEAFSERTEVSIGLLGVVREEIQQRLMETVNSYGLNTSEFALSRGYTYSQDPPEFWLLESDISPFAGQYGIAWRWLPEEAAIQCYCYPPPSAFVWPSESLAAIGRFPGGESEGVMIEVNETVRAFRYQPGRPNLFTLGIRTNTIGATPGSLIRWGIRNQYGDAVYLEIEGNANLSVVRQNQFIGEERVPLSQWNGRLEDSGWTLDPSKVTMYRIEMGWYGAIGAKLLAYLPSGHGESRWVKLHQFVVENKSEFPSLRNPFFRIFQEVRALSGCTGPQFVNLYGSSVYIDGGDTGVVTTGTASVANRAINGSVERCLVGLQIRARIPNAAFDPLEDDAPTENQKAVYPILLSVDSTVDARLSLRFIRPPSVRFPATYGYLAGRVVSCSTPGPAINASVVGFPSGSELTRRVLQLSGSDYSSITTEETTPDTGGRPRYNAKIEKISGAFPAIANTYIVQKLGSNQVLLNIPLPAGYSGAANLRLNRYTGRAISTEVIRDQSLLNPSAGRIYFSAPEGRWRIGIWVDTGAAYNPSAVLWASYSSTTPTFAGPPGNLQVSGERVMRPHNDSAPFLPIIEWSVGPSSELDPTPTLRTIYGTGPFLEVSTPLPVAYELRVVLEMANGASLSNVVFDNGTLDLPLITSCTWALSGGAVSTEPATGPYVATSMERLPNNPLSGALVDKTGEGVLINPEAPSATFFIQAGETRQIDLRPYFGLNREFLSGAPEVSDISRGALFLTGIARSAGSGLASASMTWEEQG